ncbi:unnamed protein product [Spirodela intermedia]|uniref:Uncharacterized protein n=1 Tax=Spirodela intermedia TaxID=51605 RepID=A0A7I8KE15_SPIIN|nr:unnamed protein product [Spirodela intermedia]
MHTYVRDNPVFLASENEARAEFTELRWQVMSLSEMVSELTKKNVLEKFIELEELFLLNEMIKEHPETHLQNLRIGIHKETVQLVKIHNEYNLHSILKFLRRLENIFILNQKEKHWSTDIYHASEYTYGNVHLLPKTSHLWIIAVGTCRYRKMPLFVLNPHHVPRLIRSIVFSPSKREEMFVLL